ncbi:hypothetical protein N7488_011659 [Penicillium malachiteum]|nr:hypothetical protein N7488_011659 [Penicillium malachiteum]
MLMPSRRIMDAAMVYVFEDLPNSQKAAFRWPNDDPNDLFYSVAAAGLVSLCHVGSRTADLNFPSMETPEGVALAQQIITILDQFQIKQTGVRFLFVGRKSIIDPEPQACLTLFVPAEREQVDDTWLKCARMLRSLLIDNELESQRTDRSSQAFPRSARHLSFSPTACRSPRSTSNSTFSFQKEWRVQWAISLSTRPTL